MTCWTDSTAVFFSRLLSLSRVRIAGQFRRVNIMCCWPITVYTNCRVYVFYDLDLDVYGTQAAIATVKNPHTNAHSQLPVYLHRVHLARNTPNIIFTFAPSCHLFLWPSIPYAFQFPRNTSVLTVARTHYALCVKVRNFTSVIAASETIRIRIKIKLTAKQTQFRRKNKFVFFSVGVFLFLFSSLDCVAIFRRIYLSLSK